MDSADFYTAHFLVDGAITDDFAQLFFELVQVSCDIPDNCLFLLATQLVLSINRQIRLMSSLNSEWEWLNWNQWLIYMEIFVSFELVIS